MIAIRARIRSASRRWLPANRAGRITLRIHSARADADQHEHREDIDQEGKPALIAQPRQRGVLGDHPDQRDQDRRGEDEKAPEDEGVDQARPQPLQQLALAEHDCRLVAHPAGTVAGAGYGRTRANESEQEPHTLSEQDRAHPRQRGEHDGGDEDAYVPFTFLISAEIAGTTSCRSPITA